MDVNIDYTTHMLEDTKIRSPELFFENIIKTLAEPKVIETLNRFNNLLQTDKPPPSLYAPGWYAVLSGGDALNYYYPSTKYIPTHDWDIRLLNVTTNIIRTDDAVKMIGQGGTVDQFMTTLRDELNLFFSNIVLPFGQNIKVADIINKRNTIRFFYIHNNTSKWNYLQYEYCDNSVTPHVKRQGRLVDIVVANLINGSYNESKYQKKYTKESLDKMYNEFLLQCPYLHPDWTPEQCKDANTANAAVINAIQTASRDPGGTIYPNSIELVIQDTLSGIYYMAPGDLLADTMNMIYLSSIDNTDVSGVPRNNKIARYMIKYANLLDVINKFIELCPGNSCEEITKYVIQRNTNSSFVCDWNDENEKHKLFLSVYLPSLTISNLTISKICEMCKVFETIVNPDFIVGQPVDPGLVEFCL